MLRRVFAAATAAVISLGLVLVAPAAAHADTVICDPVLGECYTIIDSPPSDPAPNPDPETGFTPGPQSCAMRQLFPDEGVSRYIEVECSTGNNWWSNERGCYMSLADEQRDPPANRAPSGAWYTCMPHPDQICGNECFGWTNWLDSPPPGVTQLTPGQAAQRIVDTFQLQGVDIGLAPNPDIPNSKSYIGVPIWMWVTNPQPLSFGPYEQTTTLGGVTITAVAQVTSMRWDMGDGNVVTCGTAGTEYQVGFGPTDSPTCGHRYAQTSDDQPGGRFPITATSQWSVEWTGGGEDGAIPLTRTSETSVDINEMQSVNVR